MLSSGIHCAFMRSDFGHKKENVKVYIENENVYTGVNKQLIAANATLGRIYR
jgi:hypothetical protein